MDIFRFLLDVATLGVIIDWAYLRCFKKEG